MWWKSVKLLNSRLTLANSETVSLAEGLDSSYQCVCCWASKRGTTAGTFCASPDMSWNGACGVWAIHTNSTSSSLIKTKVLCSKIYSCRYRYIYMYIYIYIKLKLYCILLLTLHDLLFKTQFVSCSRAVMW